MQGVLLASGKPGAVRIVGHKSGKVLELGFFRPTTHKDFVGGKLRLRSEMGAVAQLVPGIPGVRASTAIISKELAVALYHALGSCLTKEEIENTVTEGD